MLCFWFQFMHSDRILSPPIIANLRYIHDELSDQLKVLEGKKKKKKNFQEHENVIFRINHIAKFQEEEKNETRTFDIGSRS